VRIRCLSTGRVRLKRRSRGARRYIGDDWSAKTLPVNSFLLEHAQGLCLFDAGQTALAATPGYFPAWYPFFRLSRFELSAGDEVSAQLTQLGYDIADVRWVVLSHLHTDHVGGLEAFRGAEVLVSRREWEDAQALRGRLRGYLPQYWPDGLTVRPVDFNGPPIGPFPSSHDVAGDGVLVLVPTPGHTRGHMALLARDDQGRFLCGGDIAHTAAELAEAAPAIDSFCRREAVVPLLAHDASAARFGQVNSDVGTRAVG
jgi:glyoxylase-like metal-dependent hydrolase (beta-lactamase superfamily II)